MIFHHVLNYVALAFQVLDFCHFGVFGQQFKFLAQRGVDNLAVGPIVELSADIVLDQDVDFGVRVDGQGEQSFFEVIILSISPVEFVLLPHFSETVQANTFAVVGVLFEHFVEDVLVENLAAYFKKGHQFWVLELAAHQQVQFAENVHNQVLLVFGFLDSGL
jgi:hypothetical protein